MSGARPRRLRRGTCVVCGRDIAVVKATTKIRAHKTGGVHCNGTGRESATTPRRVES